MARDLKEIARILAGISEERQIYEFLIGLLTPGERERIGLRWRLVKLLARGMKQRSIAEKLGVSLCKITRGSYELKHGPRGFRDVVEEACGNKIRKGG